MPATLADARKSHFTETHLELVSEHQSDDQLTSITARPLAGCDCGRKNVGGVAGVLLPVDVVVVHAADHQSIGERSRYRIYLLAAADQGRLTRAGDLIQNFQRDIHFRLLITTESASHAVEKKTLRLIDCVRREVFKT